MTICLLDTSILLELLAVPSKASRSAEINQQLRAKLEAKESLFLPMATVLETGNHIGQNGDGSTRWHCFVGLVKEAISGSAPFQAINFPSSSQMSAWLAEFPAHAKTGSGLGDLSIVHEWRRLHSLSPARRVYIWTLDSHLAAYDSNQP